MNYGICHIPIIPCRGDTSEKSELVTQILFGEKYEVIEEKKDWIRIKTLWDHYTGWINISQLFFTSKPGKKDMQPPYFLSKDIYSRIIETGTDQSMYIPMGSRLNFINDDLLSIENKTWIFKGNFTESIHPKGGGAMVQAALLYLNSPYLWGGRSPMGIDCSALIQMAAIFCGINMPRDASMQVLQGSTVQGLQNSMAGDIAFFHNDQGAIIHTGILTGNGYIIHASGYVRINKIDENGILINDCNTYSHRLAEIKRYTN